MVKLVLLGLVAVGVYVWWSSSSSNKLASSSPSSQLKANNGNSGFNVGIGVSGHGVRLTW